MAGPITGAQNPNMLATIAAARALAPLKNATVAWGVANMDYNSELAGFGKQVDIPIPAEFASNLIADGGTITRQNPALGNASLILNKHREVSWEHTDINKLLATPNLQGLSLGQAIANLAEDMDEDLLSVYSQFTTADVGAYATSLTEAVIDSAETSLFNQRASGPKNLIVNGNGFSALRLIPRFSEADKRGGGDSASDSVMGMLKGFTVHRAQGVNLTGGTDAHGVAMARTALLGAVRSMGTPGNGQGAIQVEMAEDGVSVRYTQSYHHEALGGLSTLDVLYGFVAGRVNHGVEVRH